MPIKAVEIRVRSRINRVEVGGGLPGSPGEPGADGADGVSVTGASINGSGHLILTLSSGGPIDVGYVIGPEGDQGPPGNDGTDGTDGAPGADGTDGVSITGAVVNGSGDLIISLSTGGTVNAGNVIGPVGPDGDPGADGVSITGATVDGSYNLILSLSTGGTINAGYVRGPAGAGSGDVIGPASSTTGNFASYGDGTGKLIADSGVGPASFATAAQGTKADNAVVGAGTVTSGNPVVFTSTTGQAVGQVSYATFKTSLALTKGDVGLGNVDNTSDANKPISTATQTALDNKVAGIASSTNGNPMVFSGTSGKASAQVTFAAFKTSLALVKADVGLGNVDNTSDANKPVSTATQTALDAKVAGPASSVANRIATFNGTTGKLIADSGKLLPTGDVVGTTDTQTLSGKTMVAPVINDGYTEETVTANTGTTYTIDLANGSVQILTLTGNCTLTFPTATAGRSFTLLLKQDATGSRTATWPSSVKWPGSVAPVITATASKADLFAFTADGTNWISRRAGSVYL